MTPGDHSKGSKDTGISSLATTNDDIINISNYRPQQ